MRFLKDAFITIVLVAVGLWAVAYAKVAGGGLSAEAQPGALERVVATRLVDLSIPRDHREQQNPFASKTDAWREAAEHYADHCAICHGADGRGHTEIGEHMYPKVPDLASDSVQHRSNGALFYIIQNGVRWTGMPAWRTEHAEDETWKLVSFIRHVPTLSPSDIANENDREPAEQPHRHPHKQ